MEKSPWKNTRFHLNNRNSAFLNIQHKIATYHLKVLFKVEWKYKLSICEKVNFWPYFLIMSRMCFRVNPHSIVTWLSRNSLLKIGALLETWGLLLLWILFPCWDTIFCLHFNSISWRKVWTATYKWNIVLGDRSEYLQLHPKNLCGGESRMR